MHTKKNVSLIYAKKESISLTYAQNEIISLICAQKEKHFINLCTERKTFH